jgi:hypothetical protein
MTLSKITQIKNESKRLKYEKKDSVYIRLV